MPTPPEGPAAPPPAAGRPAGVAAPGRLALVDALRGAAMLGIMLVNFPSMNTASGDETTLYGGVHGALDQAVNVANLALCNGKLYPVFALLFGWGLAVQRRGRAGGDGGGPTSYLLRRLLVLLLIGALHVTLVWWGDILVVYAVLGLVLLPCLRWGDRALLRAALALLLLVPLASPLLAALRHLGYPASGAVVLPGLGLPSPPAEAAALVYAQGRLPEMLRQRLLDYLSDFTPFAHQGATLGALAGYATYYAQLAGLFLLGAWAARRDLAARPWAGEPWARALWRWAGIAAAALTALRYGVPALGEHLYYPQGEALALFYVASFCLAFPSLGRWARPFQAVGRMSLTAYLAHTTAASLLLYGTGLGLYGRVGPAALLPLSLACYALVAACCLAWLRAFRLGPAEWAWRSLVAGRPEPLARRTPLAP
jgi:uncharacterized protein